MKEILAKNRTELCEALWEADPALYRLLGRASTLGAARNQMVDYLNALERKYFNIYSRQKWTKRSIIERDNAKECIRVLKNVIRTENERLTGFSALEALYRLARGAEGAQEHVGEGFLSEFICLFRGIHADARLFYGTYERLPADSSLNCEERTECLNRYASRMEARFARYRMGLDDELRQSRRRMEAILKSFFDAREDSWHDYRWQLSHVISDRATLEQLVHLDEEEREGLRLAEELDIPFQVTPYYLSLFRREGRDRYDRGVRSQVLPSPRYCRMIEEDRTQKRDQDYMGERMCSPMPCITRRYPEIAILKPFDSCPQICVYCQRNWELASLEKARFHVQDVKQALRWIEKNPSIREVLLTGGDPFTLSNHRLEWILGRLASIDSVERIRIGTRFFATIPYRFTEETVALLRRFHQWGRREIALMTHMEHPAEITEDFLDAVTRIKQAGLNIYNQQVFTYYTSRRFETCYLRRNLKRCGVDPYYTFNTKGKEETMDFRVPMARLQQERHEEARLMPGLVRMDEPVFNVPRQGKSSLVAWQDHEPVMILPQGNRVYRFYPWESRIAFAKDYLYEDVPIYDYLKRLAQDGEDPDEYASIWYYF